MGTLTSDYRASWEEQTKYIIELEALNEKLLAALKEYLDWHETNFILPSGNFEDPDQRELAKNARAVIKLAKS